jgi:hypothetical protein
MRSLKNNFKKEELISLVTELAEKYTSKESTSISYETAKQLMNAILYCINEYEASFHDNYQGENGKLARNLNAKTVYENGYELVIKKVIEGKEIYEEIIKDFSDYGNIGYYDTIVKGMPLFFLHYDPKYKPQDHILTLDYPTIKSVHKLNGIDAVYVYLKFIKTEQVFLSVLKDDLVRHILMKYHFDFEELFINISSIVLRYMIGCMIANKNIHEVEFTEEDFYKIHNFVIKYSTQELEMTLIIYIKRLVEQYYFDNKELFEYLKEDAKNFSFELRRTAESNCVEAVFGYKK